MIDQMTVDDTMDVWREPVRGGYPDQRVFDLTGLEQLQLALKEPPPTLSDHQAHGDGD